MLQSIHRTITCSTLTLHNKYMIEHKNLILNMIILDMDKLAAQWLIQRNYKVIIYTMKWNIRSFLFDIVCLIFFAMIFFDITNKLVNWKGLNESIINCWFRQRNMIDIFIKVGLCYLNTQSFRIVHTSMKIILW